MRYAPANLKLAIDRVKQTYLLDEATADAGPPLRVVGTNGEILCPRNQSACDQVFEWLFGKSS